MLSNLRCHTCSVAHVRRPLTHSLRCSNRQHAAAQRPHTHRSTLVPQNILTDRQLGEGVLMRSAHKCHLFANPPTHKNVPFFFSFFFFFVLKTATTVPSVPWQGVITTFIIVLIINHHPTDTCALCRHKDASALKHIYGPQHPS